MIHTVIVSYERPELLKRTVKSYCETVTLPFRLVVVDNASGDETRRMLRGLFSDGYVDTIINLTENRYPGFATNEGFAIAEPGTEFLHRSDNDMEYLPGWCDEVLERFEDPLLWQLGLRTLEEEGPNPNVGGNCIFRREAWEAGVRYSEEPWTRVPFEDTMMARQIREADRRIARVLRPCAVHIGLASRDDPYYQKTFAERRITFEMYGL